MSEMSQHLDTMVVEAMTPDETAFARLRGRQQVEVRFAPGYYAHADDARVVDKLQKLGKLLWVARMKEFYRFQSELLGREIRGEGTPETPAQERRREARNSTVVTSRSSDGLVEIESVGLLAWSVTVPPGTVPSVAEETFTTSCGEAAERLIEHWVNKAAYVWAQDYSS